MLGPPLWTEVETAGSTVHVTVRGTLSAVTAALLRDELVKHTAGGPDALAVHVDALAWDTDLLLTIFSVVARRIDDWPGTTLVLVCRDQHLRAALDRVVISRFVRVVSAASRIANAVHAPNRMRAWRTFQRLDRAVPRLVTFVQETCDRWHADQFAQTAVTVAGELVENALQHTSADPHVRLELRRGMFTVAVTDDSPRKPVLLESPGSRDRGLGLRLVAGLSRVWSVTSTPSGGKVVWAVLTEASLRGQRR